MNTSNRQRSVQPRLDEQWNNFFHGLLGNEVHEKRALPMDVAETKELFRIEMDLPGLSMSDIELSFYDKTLNLQVTKNVDVEEHEDLKWHRRDRVRQSLQESLRFPVAIDAESIEASLSDGVLTITLPKAAEAKPKTIQIK